MSQELVSKCDACGVVVPAGKRLAVRVGEMPRFSGHGREVMLEMVDLCQACSTDYLEEFVRDLSDDEGTAWVKRVRDRGRRHGVAKE